MTLTGEGEHRSHWLLRVVLGALDSLLEALRTTRDYKKHDVITPHVCLVRKTVIG